MWNAILPITLKWFAFSTMQHPQPNWSSYNHTYGKLRSWYLAHLKEEASNAQATPMARIELDRAFMERVVVEAQPPGTASATYCPGRLSKPLPVVMVAVNLMCLVLASVLTPTGLNTYFACTWGRLVGASATSVEPAVQATITGIFYGISSGILAMLPARYLLVHDNISAGKKSLNAGWPFFAFTQALTAIVATTALASCPLIVPGEFQLTATTCLSWLCVLTGAGLFLSRSATLQHEHRLQLLLADAHNRLSLTRTLDGLNEQELLEELEIVLQALSSRESAIADYSKDLICCVSADLKILALNQTSHHFMGSAPIELIGSELPAQIAPADRTSIEKQFLEARNARKPITAEAGIIRNRNQLRDTSWLIEWSQTEQSKTTEVFQLRSFHV